MPAPIPALFINNNDSTSASLLGASGLSGTSTATLTSAQDPRTFALLLAQMESKIMDNLFSSDPTSGDSDNDSSSIFGSNDPLAGIAGLGGTSSLLSNASLLGLGGSSSLGLGSLLGSSGVGATDLGTLSFMVGRTVTTKNPATGVQIKGTVKSVEISGLAALMNLKTDNGDQQVPTQFVIKIE